MTHFWKGLEWFTNKRDMTPRKLCYLKSLKTHLKVLCLSKVSQYCMKTQVFSILADSTLLFQVQLINLERLSLFNRIHPILQFAVWPLGLFAVVWYMYNKINTAIQKEERERKPDRKSSRKKRWKMIKRKMLHIFAYFS